MRICVVRDESLHSFHPYFGSAVGVWECYRGESVVDAPVFQECACGICHELGSTDSCTLIWDAKGGEEPAEGVNNALGPLLSSFNDGPVRVAVHSDKVVPTFVAEEIGADALEGVCWWSGRVGWGTWL